MPIFQNRKDMGKRNTQLPHATVARICHVKKGIKVQQAAVAIAAVEAEKVIQDIMKGALAFTENRGGSMIMEKDVRSYLKPSK